MVYLVGICGVFGLGMCFALLGAVSVKLMPRLNIDQSKYGSLVSAFMLCCLVASLVVGVTMDSVGYLPIAVFGFIAAGIAIFALSRAKNYGMALLAFLLLGFAAMALNTVGNVLGTKAFAGAEWIGSVPKAQNLLNVFFGLGLFTSPFLISFLFQKTTYEKAVSVLAAIITVPALFALLANYAPYQTDKFVFSDAFSLLTEPACIVAALVLFCYIALEASFTNWLAPLGKEIMTAGKKVAPEQEKKIDASAQRLLSVFAIFMMLGRFATGITGLADYGTYVIAGASIVSVVAILGMMRVKTGGAAFALAALGGLAFAPCFPTTIAVAFGKFPKGYPGIGSLFGIIFAVGLAGAVIIPKAIGNLAKGSTVQKSLKLLVPACVLLLILALVFGVVDGPAQAKPKGSTTKSATSQPVVKTPAPKTPAPATQPTTTLAPATAPAAP